MQKNTPKTTLFLIPGGRELALPEHSEKLRSAMVESITERTAKIMMLADKPLIPEKQLHTIAKYKTVLLIETDQIYNEDDAWGVAFEVQADNYLPVIESAGFDFQVIRMEAVAVKYEDFEIIDKYL
ncbi:hypothetical protein AAEO56_01275 [Flavobacterium sp. DGU11]|uniref:Uncharacterized protein n=1 Tax=Flavobacterium arundinis TaxID=3139143 RepID=A0ABU9HSI0_9FLAO